MHRRPILSFLSSLFCLLITLLATSDLSRAQDATGNYGNDAMAIEKLLHKQQEAWNKHDLEGFMAGYWNSEQLTFFSGARSTTDGRPR